MTSVSDPQAIDRALAGSTARLLSACARSAGALGLACAALAAAALLLRAPGGSAGWLLAVLAAAPLERLLALRLHFDAGLFDDLGRGPQAMTLPALDQALHTLRLRPATLALRPLADRARGAQRLVFWHLACVALQFGALLLATTPAWKGLA